MSKNLMIKWRTIESEKIVDSPYMQLRRDTVIDAAGRELEYFWRDSNGSVMVIPVRTDKHTPRYIMVEQYRYPLKARSLEFPAGGRERGEPMTDAAARELKQETGYNAENLKLIYSAHEDPSRSNASLHIYLALVTGEHSNSYQDPDERASKMRILEFTTEELHKKILDNEITCSHTLAALCALLMQSPNAKEYLGIDESSERGTDGTEIQAK